MKKLRFKSLAMRIWMTFTATILVIICSISVLYFGAFKRINENARMQDLKLIHDILLKSNNYSQPFSRFDELRNLKGSDYFIVNIDDNNTQILDVNKTHEHPESPEGQPHGPFINSKEVEQWMAGYAKGDDVYEKQFKEVYKGSKFLFIISSINYGSTGKSYLVSYVPSMDDNSLLYMVLGICVIFIFIGFVTSKAVANYISKPLKELEDFTIRIAQKDWKEPIQIKSEDEIGRFAESMNRMQKELKHADEEEKMFLQSISHDLKTPVMVIMSHADAIIDGVYIDSAEKTAEIIRDEAVCLEKKIKQMLYLNTLDYVLENKNEELEINLREMLRNIISRFEIINSKIDWDLNLDDVVIKGNVDKVKVAVENILDNGLRYAEEKVCLTLKEEDSFAVLEIYNDGPNIGEKHLSHIFENMYKDKMGNFGLGLAITKKIIDFYKGEINAVNRDKGVSFIIKFPICK